MPRINTERKVRYMDYMYLVGVSWYSADQGDYPNTDEFPSFVSDDEAAAEAEYRRLAQGDKSWGYGARCRPGAISKERRWNSSTGPSPEGNPRGETGPKAGFFFILSCKQGWPTCRESRFLSPT